MDYRFLFFSNDFLVMNFQFVLMLYVSIKRKKYFLNKRKSTNLIKGYESFRKLTNKEKKNFNAL